MLLQRRCYLSLTFFKPLISSLLSASNRYEGPVLSDSLRLEAGVRHCLTLVQSGRDFLQHLFDVHSLPLRQTTFFESLKSHRRLALSREINKALLLQLNSSIPDSFAAVDPAGALSDFDLFAADSPPPLPFASAAVGQSRTSASNRSLSAHQITPEFPLRRAGCIL